jgi:demethylmenaquinone methyltransferase/2-methoxy-6-polyprenyl-1,4-benzoquinol methylase
MSDEILREQMSYYQARAPEYDEWFYRKGRYDRGVDANDTWLREAETVLQVLRSAGNAGSAVELACGTGIWTRELAAMADRVTALDASAEMLNLNREKVAAENVAYEQTDLFTWEPAERYDLLHASFWLSHVPPDLLEEHLAVMRRAIRPGGRLFLVDSRQVSTSTSADQPIPGSGWTMARRLNDGRTFRIVKRYYDPEWMQATLTDAGFEVTVHTTHTYFWYATGVRR